MPLDLPAAAHPVLAARVPDLGASDTRGQRQVGLWLLTIAFMILVMVVLGGTTRLTGSGLSIMEWAPLSGALPPLTHAEWERLFTLYKQIPQYDLVNDGMTLAGFRHIFWLEWMHRLWGRLLGVAFILPLAWFWWRGRVDRRLGLCLTGFAVLGGLQGAVGWFMVASGFLPDMTSVSPGRLVAHLVLALLLYALILWTGLSRLQPRPAALPGHRATRRLAALTLAAVSLTIVAGGFVAGLHAGLIYNTFPLMDGRLVPESYASLSPFLRNLTENVAAVQFDHRLLATLTAALALATGATGLRHPAPTALRTALAALALAVLAQFALGVTTLLLVVPVPLAAAHQAMAVILLTAALVCVHALRRAGETEVPAAEVAA